MPSARREFDPQLVLEIGRERQQPEERDRAFPVGLMTCVTGVSGSGKSTLVNDTLYRPRRRRSTRAARSPRFKRVKGLEHFDHVIDIGQAHRANAELQSRDVQRPAHADPRAVRRRSRSALARLRARAVQLQREGRPLRDVPRRRRDPGRDALPARHLRACDVPRQALQPRNARNSVQGKEHLRGAGDDRGRSARFLPQRADGRARSRRR